MNSHIYVDKETPAVSLIEERLTDGSKVWNIHLATKDIGCRDERRAHEAMAKIAEALRGAAVGSVLHL